MELIANRRMTYATRRLLPGDRFIADERVARVLIATRKATKAHSTAGYEAQDTGVGAAAHELVGRADKPEDDMAALRAEYTDVIGKRPFHGWDAGTLRAKIDEAKG